MGEGKRHFINFRNKIGSQTDLAGKQCPRSEKAA